MDSVVFRILKIDGVSRKKNFANIWRMEKQKKARKGARRLNVKAPKKAKKEVSEEQHQKAFEQLLDDAILGATR
jgi:hypothetical protein